MSSDDVLILGLGKTGLSCLRFLHERGLSACWADTREHPALESEFSEKERTLFPRKAFSLVSIQSARRVVVSPGLPLDHPALKAAKEEGIDLIGDIELFAEYAKAPILAVTGSNAKGTVCTLLALMLEHAGFKVGLGGNIGTPALELLSSPCDVYVLELSSFQLETTISLCAKSACILNISPDHLDRHGSMEAYRRAKQRIYRGCDAPVANRDDPLTLPEQYSSRPLVTFGLSEPGAGDFGVRMRSGVPWLARGAEYLMPTTHLALRGRHNSANALAAMALAQSMVVPMASMLEVLRSFKGLPHRCQSLGVVRGRCWVDDSKATNVGAAIAALDGFAADLHAGRLVWLGGGLSKGADLSLLAPVLSRAAACAIIYGQDAPLLESVLSGVLPVHRVETLKAAVALASDLSQEGDTILLSPACASQDQFRDYVDRGEAFARYVQALESCAP